MTTFLTTLLITFFTFIGAAILLQFCKERASNGKHQLTGMCHRKGGAVCCSCSDLTTIHRHEEISTQ